LRACDDTEHRSEIAKAAARYRKKEKAKTANAERLVVLSDRPAGEVLKQIVLS